MNVERAAGALSGRTHISTPSGHVYRLFQSRYDGQVILQARSRDRVTERPYRDLEAAIRAMRRREGLYCAR